MPPKKKQKRGSPGRRPLALEYRATDDAWYGVHLRLEDHTLVINYDGFPPASDDRVDADGFNSQRELDEFRARFRLPSLQLQDQDCRRVTEGQVVCVSHASGADELRFYDAVVEKVVNKHGLVGLDTTLRSFYTPAEFPVLLQAYFREHSGVGGKAVCNCVFFVEWQHGPDMGKNTWTFTENICWLQQGTVQEKSLESFSELCQRKLESDTSYKSHPLHSEVSEGLRNCGGEIGED